MQNEHQSAGLFGIIADESRRCALPITCPLTSNQCASCSALCTRSVQGNVLYITGSNVGHLPRNSFAHCEVAGMEIHLKMINVQDWVGMLPSTECTAITGMELCMNGS